MLLSLWLWRWFCTVVIMTIHWSHTWANAVAPKALLLSTLLLVYCSLITMPHKSTSPRSCLHPPVGGPQAAMCSLVHGIHCLSQR